jgi:GNAT superfamily N-acetyltransferase
MVDVDPRILVKRRYDELASLIQQVKAHADAARHSLGFLPEQVYQQAALQQKILVAVASRHSGEEYSGHLLFGGTFPHLKVFQIYVAPAYRGRGIATLLIDTLVREAEALGHLSISARVAQDLREANQFWQKNGFFLARSRLGGASTGRTINVRVRELKTPNLFTVLGRVASVDLGLEARLSERHPTYALDLNAMFDLTKQRSNADSVSRIFNAALNQVFVLRVTEEFVNELRRSSFGEPDPILKLALTLPQFPAVPSSTLDSLTRELANEIFPARADAGRLSVQDRSDLIHLASAIHHKAAGFITSEKAILVSRRQLQSKYGLEVVGPAELAESITSSQWLADRDFRRAHGCEILVSQLEESQRTHAEQFLASQSIPTESVTAALGAGATGSLRRRLLIRTSSDILGFASWDPPHALRDELESFVYVDEDHLGAEAILDYLIDHAIADASETGPIVISLRLHPGQALARRAAVAHGFRASEESSGSHREVLRKICVGRVVTHDNWSFVRTRIQKIARVVLPESMPEYEGDSTSLTIGTPRGDVIRSPLAELETLLGPVLFLLPSRSGAIVPIRRRFAEELFDSSPQRSLLPRQEAALFTERVYYSDPKTVSILKAGMPILFYESMRDKGRGTVFACGRIVRVELRTSEEVTNDLERRGVLSAKIMRAMRYSGQVAITFFDNITKLKNPVEWQVLRQMHCIDRANLVTARTLRADQLYNLLTAGQADG